MIKYFFPFYYTYHSRSKGLHFLSYLIMVVFPQFLLCWFYGNNSSESLFLMNFTIAFCGMLSVYEWGYIVNDSVCIKNDPHPTIRISIEEQNYLKEHIVPVSICKILVSVFCILFFIFEGGTGNSILYICSLFILFSAYLIHNSVRSVVNFITVFILTTFNYFSSVAALCGSEKVLCFAVIVLSFSIPKTIFYIRRKALGLDDVFGFAVFYFAETILFCLISIFCDFDFRLILIPFSQFVWRFCTSFWKYKSAGRGIK